MPAKSKRLTNKEKAIKSKAKKELQKQGLLPPDKPRLNRKKFAKEAAEQFDKEINLMDPMDVFWFHNALTLVTAGTDMFPITPEQVGGLLESWYWPPDLPASASALPDVYQGDL